MTLKTAPPEDILAEICESGSVLGTLAGYDKKSLSELALEWGLWFEKGTDRQAMAVALYGALA